MKKIIIGIVSLLIVVIIAIAIIINFGTKSNSDNTESQEIEQKNGYKIVASKKDITINKGSTTSFNITFTNPDELSIREYIDCKDKDDIIIVRYTALENRKITVEVEALKVGTTEIVIYDYDYPDMKEIVKVNVVEATSTDNKITKDIAYEGVNNYCHKEYDWSNPTIMYVNMGEETESEYQVIFRNYTGAFVYFYVNKKSGLTRIVEYVPELDVKEEIGNINIYDYLDNNN